MSRRGFTLIEVSITIALFVVVMSGMAELYLVYGRAVVAQQAAISIALDGSSIIDAVSSTARQADHVVAAHTFSGAAYTSGTTTAVFELPAYDASGASISNAFDYIGITASGAHAYRLTDAATGSVRVSGSKQLAQTLESLSFAYDATQFPSVTSLIVSATTSMAVRGATSRLHLQEHFYLRNL